MKVSADLLLEWYLKNGRPLPWRTSRDPYRIWISEIMLQQTTSKAVVPFFERFLARFPTVQSLAQSSLDEVYEAWSGLGYYSRARNLHRCAGLLSQRGFPQSFSELLELPGIGPYTSRAIASFAFSEPVGVLDGNVIRFLSRYHLRASEWWKPKGRDELQSLADEWVRAHVGSGLKKVDSHDINQALIEIGATICTPQSPKCLLCPVVKNCGARKEDRVQDLPLQKPRKAMEDWVWRPQICARGGKFALTKDHQLPVLTDHLAWPGKAQRVKAPPKKYAFKHVVTHHNIYVLPEKAQRMSGDLEWLRVEDIKRKSPTALVQKALRSLSEAPSDK